MLNPDQQDVSEASLAYLVEKLSISLLQQGLLVATVESCTGGSIAAAFTNVAGSSRWFDRGFVTYSDRSKVEMVGVNSDTLTRYGAVSEAVAIEMAEGGVRHSDAACALSITGIAGPGGGTPEKPVGMVCFGWAGFGSETRVETKYFSGNRTAIRLQSANYAIRHALPLIRV